MSNQTETKPQDNAPPAAQDHGDIPKIISKPKNAPVKIEVKKAKLVKMEALMDLMLPARIYNKEAAAGEFMSIPQGAIFTCPDYIANDLKSPIEGNPSFIGNRVSEDIARHSIVRAKVIE